MIYLFLLRSSGDQLCIETALQHHILLTALFGCRFAFLRLSTSAFLSFPLNNAPIVLASSSRNMAAGPDVEAVKATLSNLNDQTKPCDNCNSLHNVIDLLSRYINPFRDHNSAIQKQTPESPDVRIAQLEPGTSSLRSSILLLCYLPSDRSSPSASRFNTPQSRGDNMSMQPQQQAFTCQSTKAPHS